MTQKSWVIYTTLITGGLLLVMGIDQDSVPHKEVSLTEKSPLFQPWKNASLPVYTEFYFFNVTNPEEFLVGGKASVQQIGPYTYREYSRWENICFLDNDTKVYAQNLKTFAFVPEMSAGDPEVDTVRTVNIPLVMVMNNLNSHNFFLRAMISMYVRSLKAEIFTTRTVHEILWGFKDPLLSKIHEVNPEVDDHFGLMWKNDTHKREYIFHTGKDNYLDYGKIDTYNGLSQLNWWSSNQSNMINGTDGTVFHPLIKRNELLYMFATDLCRSIHLAYEKDVEVKGIEAYRFTLPTDVLESPDNNPTNAGFCVPPGDCLGSGVLKVSSCQKEASVWIKDFPPKGTPFVMSFPHFYQADAAYISAVDGLKPMKEEHETFLDLEPITGQPINACKRTQLNIILKRFPGFINTKYINETIFPVMFVNKRMTLNDDSAAKMKKLPAPTTAEDSFVSLSPVED